MYELKMPMIMNMNEGVFLVKYMFPKDNLNFIINFLLYFLIQIFYLKVFFTFAISALS